jgi:hypothetical protein
MNYWTISVEFASNFWCKEKRNTSHGAKGTVTKKQNNNFCPATTMKFQLVDINLLHSSRVEYMDSDEDDLEIRIDPLFVVKKDDGRLFCLQPAALSRAHKQTMTTKSKVACVIFSPAVELILDRYVAWEYSGSVYMVECSPKSLGSAIEFDFAMSSDNDISDSYFICGRCSDIEIADVEEVLFRAQEQKPIFYGSNSVDGIFKRFTSREFGTIQEFIEPFRSKKIVGTDLKFVITSCENRYLWDECLHQSQLQASAEIERMYMACDEDALDGEDDTNCEELNEPLKEIHLTQMQDHGHISDESNDNEFLKSNTVPLDGSTAQITIGAEGGASIGDRLETPSANVGLVVVEADESGNASGVSQGVPASTSSGETLRV